ncbi:MAG: M10 family metallopeptidase C-terminal domain-containing protein [Paracraurococcus sp.]
MAKPNYDLQQIVDAIQIHWGGNDSLLRTWSGFPITYAIPDSAPPGNNDEKTGFQPLTGATWGVLKPVVASAFELWDEFVPIDLVQVPDTGADITFAYSSTTKGDGTYASPDLKSELIPGTTRTYEHDHIWFSTDPNGSKWTPQTPAQVVPAAGEVAYQRYGWQTMMHEIGHALGLSHPGSYDAGAGKPLSYEANAEFAEDTRKTTIMSYFGGWDEAAEAWVTDDTDWLYSATPTIYDIFTIHFKYGADTTTRAGDTRYGWNANAGWDFFDFGQWSASSLPAVQGNSSRQYKVTPIFAIWDAGGNDVLDASMMLGAPTAGAPGGTGVVVTSNQVIDLTPGHYSSVLGMVDNISIAWGTTIEGAAGGAGNDSITGNDANNLLQGNDGNDTLIGLYGNDTLPGGKGDDSLDGGFGNDSVAGGAGTNTVLGGAGNDTLQAVFGASRLEGGSDNDLLTSTGGGATLLGGAGNDTITGGGAGALLDGGAGNDSITIGARVLDPGSTLIGGTGDDTLTGGFGTDRFEAGAGNDLMIRGREGDPGRLFVIGLDEGYDTIRGFAPEFDRVEISGNPYITSIRDLFGSGDPAPATDTGVSLDPRKFSSGLFLEGVSPTDLSSGNFIFSPPPPQGGDFFFSGASYIPFTTSPGDIAALANGRTVIVNEMRADTIGYGRADADIYARVYAADGSILAGQVLNTTTAGQQIKPSVTGLADGGFVVTWISGVNDIPFQAGVVRNAAIHARVFDADGVPRGGEIAVISDTAGWNLASIYNTDGGLGEPEVWARPDGGFSIAWANVRLAGGTGVLRQRDFAADGTALAPERTISAALTSQSSSYPGIAGYSPYADPASVTRADGSAVLGWTEISGGFGSAIVQTTLRYATLDQNGAATGAGTIAGNGAYDPVLTALTDGRVLASWLQADGLYARTLGSGAGILIATAAELNVTRSEAHAAAALPGGATAIFWPGGGDIGGSALRVRVLGADGSVGGDELVNPYNTASDRIYDPSSPGSGDQTSPHAIALSDGKVAVTWTDGWRSFPTVRGLILDADLHGAVVGGGMAADTLRGSGWGDTITGLAGDDTLEGRAGGDRLDGGEGSDLATFEGSAAGVTVDLAAGTATDGDAAGDTLASIENLTGSAYDDFLAGTAGSNRLAGGWGNDTIIGGGGRDTLTGGPGNDSVLLDGSFGEARGGAGHDSLVATQPWVTLFGEAGNDTITATGFATLRGGDGADSLNGGTRTQVLGDAGNDSLVAGGGDFATLLGGNDDDSLSAASGDQHSLDGGAGNDTLVATGGISTTLRGGLGADSLEAAGGGSFLLESGAGEDRVLVRGGSFNTVRAGGDADRITLAEGASYVFAYGGDGADTIQGTDAAPGLSYFYGEAGDDRLTAGDGPGDRLDGGADNDTLLGGSGRDMLIDGADGLDNDSLDAGGGDDYLTSSGGRDTLIGGTGFDSAFVNRPGLLQAATILVDGSGVIGATLPDGTVLQGLEQLSIVLGSGADTVTLGAGDDAITGGAADDRLAGGAGNDTLDGGPGADLLAGGAGDDTYVLDDPGDIIVEMPGGRDTAWLMTAAGVFDAYTMAIGLEDAAVQGDGAVTVIGNELDNGIAGNADADTLRGGAGDDTLTGNGGNDRLEGGAGQDVAVFNGIADSATWARDPATGRWIVTSDDGTDTLDDVEALAFYDRTVFLPGRAVPQDLDGSGTADILWRHADGTLASWAMAGFAGTTTSYGVVDPGWTVQGTGDFNGDGKADILWRSQDGTLAQWWMGASAGGGGGFGFAGTDWTVAGLGDLDGDSHADILWRHETGTLAAWLMDGLTATGGGSIGEVGLEWVVRAVADVDGDGRGDIVWQNALDGTVALWRMNGLEGLGGVDIGGAGSDWVVLGAGDFDGDGHADLVFRNATNGDVAIWLLDGQGFRGGATVATPGVDWHVARVGDYDGDGRADLLWRDVGGTVALWLMDGLAGRAGASLGNPGLAWAVA